MMNIGKDDVKSWSKQNNKSPTDIIAMYEIGTKVLCKLLTTFRYYSQNNCCKYSNNLFIFNLFLLK